MVIAAGQGRHSDAVTGAWRPRRGVARLRVRIWLSDTRLGAVRLDGYAVAVVVKDGRGGRVVLRGSMEGGSTVRTMAVAGRDRARESRLRAVRDRRRALDPELLAREQRIDEAVLDLEDAWSTRSRALLAVDEAESLAASAIRRLGEEGVPIGEVTHLSGLELGTVRRLRRLPPRVDVDRTGAATADPASAPGSQLTDPR